MAKPTRYRLGLYDADPGISDVTYSDYTFANTPEGIEAMRVAIQQYYDRGNHYCVGVFPATGYVRIGIYNPVSDAEPVKWIGRRRKATPANLDDMRQTIAEFNRIAEGRSDVFLNAGIFPVEPTVARS